MAESFKFDVNVPAFVPSSSVAEELKDKVVPSPLLPSSQDEPVQVPKGPAKNKKPNSRKPRGQSNQGGSEGAKQPRPRKPSVGNGKKQLHLQQQHAEEWDLDEYIDEAELITGTRNRRGQVSLTHLLEFSRSSGGGGARRGSGSYDSRQRRIDRASNHRNQGTNGLYAISSSHPPSDKTTYINTTCRFVLDPRGAENYEPLMVDPDIPVPMEKVMRILSRPSACPICLDDVPKAPQMLRCGHILCLPCLLRYLDSLKPPPTPPPTNAGFGVSSYQAPKKPPPAECPLCFERIKLEHAKPVSFITFDERFEIPKEGQDVVMKLMFRPQGEWNSIPLASVMQDGGVSKSAFVEMPTMHGDGTDVAEYSRLVKGSRAYIIKELERDIQDLEKQKEEELVMYQDPEVAKFHTQAISKMRRTVFESNEVFDEDDIANGVARVSLRKDNGPLNLDNFNDSTAYYYFQTAFQSEIKYFLAPLDVKVLRAEYGGSYMQLPSSLVVHVENIIYSNYVNEELRKRLKYMSNIPAGTQVAFLECRWTSDGHNGLVSKATLDKFSKELSKRRKLKADKTHRENTHAKRIQRQEQSLLREDLLRESGVDIEPSRGNYRHEPESVISVDDPPLPSLFPDSGSLGTETEVNAESGGGAPARQTKKTVWGTSVSAPQEDARLYMRDVSEDYAWADLSKLKEVTATGNNGDGSVGGKRNNKKKSKKMVLLSSTSGGR